jgi:hypothetical protein
MVILPSYDADQIPLEMASNSMSLGRLNSHGARLASTIFDAILSLGQLMADRDQVAPRDTDTVQPKVRLRKALHRRLIDAASANKATLNGEIVRRLQESFLHELLDERLRLIEERSRLSETLDSFQKRIDQLKAVMEQLGTRFEPLASNVRINPHIEPASPNQPGVVRKTINRTKGRGRDARALAKARSGVLGNQDRGRTP